MANNKKMKQAENELDSAITFFAKTLVRSICTAGDKLRNWAESTDESKKNTETKESSVFNDGSWNKVGTDLGNAFSHFGNAIFSKENDDGTIETEATEKDESNTSENSEL